MWSLGVISFFAPWVLVGLIVLPAIWWLLKLHPPIPKIIMFPPIFLLKRLSSQRESTGRIPPWLFLLRLMLAILIILGLAGPVWNAKSEFNGVGPIYLIIDDGWASSYGWKARTKALRVILDNAERNDRQLVVTTTAPFHEGVAKVQPKLLNVTEAYRVVDSLQPKPWSTDRVAAIDTLMASQVVKKKQIGDVIWLSDGLEEPNAPEKLNSTVKHLVKRLKKIGSVTVFSDPPERMPVLLLPPKTKGAALEIEVQRVRVASSRGIQIRALSEDGQILDRIPLVFQAGMTKAKGQMEMPSEIRNKLARLEIVGSRSAGGVVLTDERWRRRPVGLLSVGADLTSQPFLDAHHYLNQAIAPFAEVRKGSLSELLRRNLAVLIIVDPGRFDPAEMAEIQAWMDNGGVVLRFAGPRLAREMTGDDPLLPVQLRRGGRTIGGALSWRKAESLAPFPASSPFYGLVIPEDIKIHRQVLAQPSLDLADKTWAELSDGTPLVTAAKRGQGWVILVHTTANAEWANLAFSGLYVGMLQRLIRLSQGVLGEAGATPLAPLSNLDAFGRLETPPGGAVGIPGQAFDKTHVSPRHPPGVYGTAIFRRALNLSRNLNALKRFESLPPGISTRGYMESGAVDLKPWLINAAALLFFLDLILSMWVRGLFGLPFLRMGALISVLCVSSAIANADDTFAMENTIQTRMAFVITGDSRIDRISEAGLNGLNLILWRRTAAELGSAQGVNPAVDELSFFPLLYWPVISGYTLPQGAGARVIEYLRNGGVVLFDTREQASDLASITLAKLSAELDIPPLVPVSPDHVLTKSFYLLKDFPGRWSGGALWVEKAGERINDGVSPVIAGSHDWAAAWAMDEQQRPLFPVVPGGEQQREMAFRFGINLVMYTLTGNYKADQVHMPAIIKRLDQ